MGPPVIACRRTFDFDLTPAELWAAIERVDRFERWWPWLEEFRLEGAALVTGSVLHGVVAPPLPYRMSVQVDLVHCAAPNIIDAVVHGDLTGDAHLRLHPFASGTRAEVSWTVEMMQRPMRLADRVAHPLLQWGHDRVVDVTVTSFRRHLKDGD